MTNTSTSPTRAAAQATRLRTVKLDSLRHCMMAKAPPSTVNSTLQKISRLSQELARLVTARTALMGLPRWNSETIRLSTMTGPMASSARSLSRSASASPAWRTAKKCTTPSTRNEPTAIWARIVKKISAHSRISISHLLRQTLDMARALAAGLRVAMRREHQRWLGIVGHRQRLNRVDGAVLGPQCVQLAHLQGAHHARVHAGRVLALGHQVLTHVALGHDPGFGAELRRAVGAGPLAVAAADALAGVDQHHPVVPLVDGARWAGGQAGRVLAVHTRRGDGVAVDVVGDVQIGMGGRGHPAAAAVLRHLAPVHAHRQVVLVFAGGHAGLAAGADARVKVEG